MCRNVARLSIRRESIHSSLTLLENGAEMVIGNDMSVRNNEKLGQLGTNPWAKRGRRRGWKSREPDLVREVVNCHDSRRSSLSFVPWIDTKLTEKGKRKLREPYDSRRLVTESRLSMKKSAAWRAESNRDGNPWNVVLLYFFGWSRDRGIPLVQTIPYFRTGRISTGQNRWGSWEAYAVFVLTIRSARSCFYRGDTVRIHQLACPPPSILPDDTSFWTSWFKMLILLSTPTCPKRSFFDSTVSGPFDCGKDFIKYFVWYWTCMVEPKRDSWCIFQWTV